MKVPIPQDAERVLFVCQDAFRFVLRVVVRVGFVVERRVVVLVRVREWLVRRAGVAGCEPAALETESFPVCPPGPLWASRPSRLASSI
jgi:hypothetical protein